MQQDNEVKIIGKRTAAFLYQYRVAARKGLSALQRLEADGMLPPADNLENDNSIIRPGSTYMILQTICKTLVREKNLEAILWLQEGGHHLNKKVLAKCAFYGDANMQASLREANLLDEELWAELSTPENTATEVRYSGASLIWADM